MTPPNLDWETTMRPDEVKWCLNKIYAKIKETNCENDCVDAFRAARAWKRTQRKRFYKLRSCCGQMEWVEYRFNWRKLRFEKYFLGFNYGH